MNPRKAFEQIVSKQARVEFEHVLSNSTRSAGRGYTPKYRFETESVRGVPSRLGHDTPMTWQVSTYGKPTSMNIKKVLDKYNKSFEPGGVNQHLRDLHHGYENYEMVGGRIIDQQNGDVIAEYNWK